MSTALLVLNVVLLIAVLGLAFLVLGALRSLGIVLWRQEQMEMIAPARIGREGIKIGRTAPDFTLPAAGGDVSLRDFAGKRVLLVLTQSGCGPCHDIAPELNRLHEGGEYRVLVVHNGDPASTRAWAAETTARFPVAGQEKFSLSKRYEVFVTPFAFLIDEHGIVRSKGIVGNRQYLNYVLTGAGQRATHEDAEPEPAAAPPEETKELAAATNGQSL